MASKYLTLWSTPRVQGPMGITTGGESTRVVYDDKNKAYWGQHKQEDLISKLTKMVGNYTKQIADGGTTTYYNPGIGGGYNRFNKFSDQQLQQAKQSLMNTQSYLEGIKNNYTQFNDFESSYDAYQGDWQALFDQTFKNTRIVADNAARSAKIKEDNEQAKAANANVSGAVESLAIAPNKTKGTGIKTAADKPGTTPFKSGLGL